MGRVSLCYSIRTAVGLAFGKGDTQTKLVGAPPPTEDSGTGLSGDLEDGRDLPSIASLRGVETAWGGLGS